MKRLITLTLFSLAAVVPIRAQWIVYDPSVHTQTMLNGVQEIAKFVEVINNQVRQINALTEQLNEFKHYESLFGDPKAVVVATVTPLLNDLRRSEVGTSLDAIVKVADGAEALVYNANGLYHSVGETFKTPRGLSVRRSPDEYRQFAAINDATANYQTVSTNSAARRVELKAQIAATIEALRGATTDAEVQKLSAVLTGLSADLHSTQQETSEALATALVQDIENRNDERKQARALKISRTQRSPRRSTTTARRSGFSTGQQHSPGNPASTPPYRRMASFDALFPTFLQRCADLRVVLLVVAYMLVIVGIIVTAMRRPSVRMWLRHFVRVIVVMSLLVFLPQWGDQTQRFVADTVTNTLKANPDQIHQAYKDTLAIKQSETEPHGLWDLFAGGTSYMVNAIIGGLLWLFAFAASLLLFWAYIFQKIMLNVGYALSPILIGFVAVPTLSSTGSRYLMHLMGVLLWPLGWGAAALISQGILDFMTDQSFITIDPTSTLYSLQNLLGLAVLAFWTVFSTCAGPIIIQKLLLYGAEVGGLLLSQGVGTFLQTAATTAGAAAVATPARSPIITAASAGIAATLSSLSLGSGMGSAGAIIIAGSGLPPRSARGRPGDDITGDKAVRELIAVSRNQAL